MWKEFKEFAIKGNMIDMAVGVIIGGAFGSLVSSVVNDLFMPFISLIIGKIDLSGLKVVIPGTDAAITYGAFLTQLIDFIIMAFVVFLFVKGINRLRNGGKTEEEPAATTKTCPYCKSEIAIEATRCPNCTSELPEEEPAKAVAEA